MKKTPCEEIIWNIIPVIRKMLACCIIHEHGLSQRETAEKMGLTPAAICQYESEKRGKEKIRNEDLKNEVRLSAEKIIREGKHIVGSEICRLCIYIRTHKSILKEFTLNKD